MGDKNFWGNDSDIVERLRSVAALKPGSELPDWLPMQNWGPVFQVVCIEAANEIEQLRLSVRALIEIYAPTERKELLRRKHLAE